MLISNIIERCYGMRRVCRFKIKETYANARAIADTFVIGLIKYQSKNHIPITYASIVKPARGEFDSFEARRRRRYSTDLDDETEELT